MMNLNTIWQGPPHGAFSDEDMFQNISILHRLMMISGQYGDVSIANAFSTALPVGIS